jgi:hypothetical protein
MTEPSAPTPPNPPDGPHLRLAGGPADAAPRATDAAGVVATSREREGAVPALALPGVRSAAEPEVWTPSDRVPPAQWAKIITGGAATALFAVGMIAQWRLPLSRYAAAAFAAVTGYLTCRMLVDGRRRRRSRQVRLLSGALYVTGHDVACVIPLDQVFLVQWRRDMDAASGLWFFDTEKKVLAHLNTEFLTDEAQARRLLAWAGTRCPLPFEVRWT